jgi:hypothetical protein
MNRLKAPVLVLIATALVCIVAGQLPVQAPVGRDCSGDVASCCGQSHKTSGHMPAKASCSTCCLMCCVMIVPAALKVAAPTAKSVVWSYGRFDPVIRTDKPPLPPPRVS